MLRPRFRRAALLVAVGAAFLLTSSLVAWAQVEPYSGAEVGGVVLTPEPEMGTPSPEVLADEVLADEVLADEVLAEDEVLASDLPFTGLHTEMLLTIAVALLLVGTALVMHARAARARRHQP